MKKPEKPPSWSIADLDFTDPIKGSNKNILANMGNISRVLRIEKDYPYWDTFKYEVKTIQEDPSILWRFVKRRRFLSMHWIMTSKEQKPKFGFNVPEKIQKSLHQFDMQMGGFLEGGSPIPDEDKNRYLISSIMEEAIASSQLEGAATTREIAKEMLRTNKKPTSLSEKMILNNYVTIKRVLGLKGQNISKEMILEIHALITKGTLDDQSDEGRFRTKNGINVADNLSGEMFYMPPDFSEVQILMDQFCAFASGDDDENFIHPIIKGIILHFLIGYIHPFMDGNGRTARAIFYWYLISKGYWLVEYMSISRIMVKAPSQYARAYLYTEYDDNDLTYFIDYNIKVLDQALKSLQEYIQLKIKEKRDILNSFKNENINERQAEILKNVLVDHLKSLTIQEIQNKFGVVYQTARTDLLGLVALGYLTEKKMGKKLVFFRADDLETRLGRR